MRYLEGTREDLSIVLQTQQQSTELPLHPTLVFINPKSGGQMGQALLKLFGEVVGVVQVSLGLRRSSITVGAHHSHNCLSWERAHAF